MKKIFVMILAIVAFSSFGLKAAEKTQAEKNFTNQVLNYLRTEGYQPSLDNDGDVKFKSEGDTYFVICNDYADGMYVKIMAWIGGSGNSRRTLLEGVNHAVSSYKFLRAYLDKDNDIVYECASYCSNFYQFKELFPRLMNVMKLGEKAIAEGVTEYN
ncbi:MAG: YbjN domain-containing protein, partial [Muribaculaceae bacterium]|nr:YbjN domain-containing protein [Muribaculaceae bacterium]